MQWTRHSHSLAESEVVCRAGRPPSNLFTGPSFTMYNRLGVSTNAWWVVHITPTAGTGCTLISAWTSVLCEESVLLRRLLCCGRCIESVIIMVIMHIFQCGYCDSVNRFLSVNQMKITSFGDCFEQLYLIQLFKLYLEQWIASVRSSVLFRLRSWKNNPYYSH